MHDVAMPAVEGSMVERTGGGMAAPGATLAGHQRRRLVEFGLSLLPDDRAVLHELRGAFYLEVAPVADLDRALHRTQMELVGSRTSLLNECFL